MWLDEQTKRDIHSIAESQQQIVRILLQIVVKTPTAIGQIQLGENMATNFSIQAGGAPGVVQFVPLPVGSAFVGPVQFTPSADDPNVSIVPHVAGVGGVPADTTGTIFDVSAPASDTSTTFNLSCTGPVGAANASISGVQAWSIVAAPPQAATSIGQVQLA